MRSAGRFIQRLVLFVGIFVIAVVAEEAARLPFGGTMTIHGPRISNATVTGEWRPDFLWMGKAWSIDVCSDEGIELTLVGGVFLIRKGNHTVYSKHDHRKTGV